MRKTILLAVLSMLVLAGCSINSTMAKTVKINQAEINVEVVSTREAMSLGLGGRNSLAENSGMLFILPDYYQPRFWMKGMMFDLDIIWIKDGVVVDLTQNIPVATTTPLKTYSPSEPVNYVLEVNDGWVKNHGVKIGDKVKF